MKCLETRLRNGIKWRRYATKDGRRVTTYELPESVVRALGITKVFEQHAKWQRGELKRTQSQQLRARVLALLEENTKPLAIAHELGISETRVRQIRQEWRNGTA